MMDRYSPSPTIQAMVTYLVSWHQIKRGPDSKVAYRLQGAGDLLCHAVGVEAMVQGLIVSSDQVDAWVGETLTDRLADLA